MPKRIDGADTVDNATHLLHRLQADGWVTDIAQVQFEYLDGGARKLPVKAVVTVELIPTKP